MSLESSKPVIRAQRRKKRLAVERFGGKCCICGYSKCLNALEFHHVDKEAKQESAAYVIMRWSWDRAKVELEKCILVCANCHREIHYNGFDEDLQVYVKNWITKICPTCKKEFDTKSHAHMYCCDTCSKVARRKTSRPSKRDLKRLLERKTSWTHMGKMFGVSDNAVRKWAKSYSLL
jgi:hypothetical protein